MKTTTRAKATKAMDLEPKAAMNDQELVNTSQIIRTIRELFVVMLKWEALGGLYRETGSQLSRADQGDEARQVT